MGRLDEALRRSGQRRDIDSSTATATATPASVFESPWSFRDNSTVRPPAHVEPTTSLLPATSAQPYRELTGLGRFNPDWLPRLVVSPNPEPILIEQFRGLAATLHQAQSDQNLRVVMITSADADEGKSLTSVNLALTLSESYRRTVLLIDADLRRPSLHEIAQVPNLTGLGETLKSSDEYKLPVYRLSDTLMLAPAGRPDMSPMGALTSPRMGEMLVEAASKFDWVLVDAPPLGPVADSSLLAPLTDATILVVRAGRTHYSSVQKAVDSIGRDRILGVVLNGAEASGPAYSHYYHYGQSTRE